ncbi:MAG: pantothenate synthase [Peltula sp. TS41687]|nr:MAG: pantothenate synthase [Peltula sp. TS41687]
MAEQKDPSSSTNVLVFRDVPSLRAYRTSLGGSVGLVPTMGALHTGHLSLMRQAASENAHVIVSIYVNPTQFAPNEDLDAYPRTWDTDVGMIQDLNVELGRRSTPEKRLGRIEAIFAPTTKNMYPTLPPSSEQDAKGSFVTITPLSSFLEGLSRPIFFRGVTTVCMKLFNIVKADRVYFGQKDIQQTIIIKRMVKDFFIDTEVKIGPTIRDPDGLALSSRNLLLGERRRKVAHFLYEALKRAENYFNQGRTLRKEIMDPAVNLVLGVAIVQLELEPRKRVRFDIDYLSLADPESLEELDVVDISKGAILSGAIKMLPLEEPSIGEDCGMGGGGATVRLIDNIILQPRQ